MDFLTGFPAVEHLVNFVSTFYWPLPLIFWPIPYGIPFLAIYLWTRSIERGVRQRPINEGFVDFDRGSWVLINYGIKAARLAAVFAALVTPPWTEGVGRLGLYGVGLGLMITGTQLRRHCFRILGENFTFSVRVAGPDTLVEQGAYRSIRHPSYTGGMMYNVGIGLALTNWESTLLLTVTMIIAYAYRVHIEECALIDVHGQQYRDYMRRTKRFIPFIY